MAVDDAVSLHVEWAERAEAIGHDPEHLVAEVLPGERGRRGIKEADRDQMVNQALQSLVENHPLVDGNKRLGWLATAVFLELNAAPVTEATNDDVYEFIWSRSRRATTLSRTSRRRCGRRFAAGARRKAGRQTVHG